jgi:hypothetical protein
VVYRVLRKKGRVEGGTKRGRGEKRVLVDLADGTRMMGGNATNTKHCVKKEPVSIEESGTGEEKKLQQTEDVKEGTRAGREGSEVWSAKANQRVPTILAVEHHEGGVLKFSLLVDVGYSQLAVIAAMITSHDKEGGSSRHRLHIGARVCDIGPPHPTCIEVGGSRAE